MACKYISTDVFKKGVNVKAICMVFGHNLFYVYFKYLRMQTLMGVFPKPLVTKSKFGTAPSETAVWCMPPSWEQGGGGERKGCKISWFPFEMTASILEDTNSLHKFFYYYCKIELNPFPLLL